ncbi:MAG: peroxidase-related enzyme [Betaproteobacteria bacterium]|nr:peroxidase-related enzyme [Betaproteobacteria bacterium]
MSATAISRFPVPDLKDLPPDIRQRIEAVQQKAGFVPNVFLALAHRPAEWRAFVAYHDALMEKDPGPGVTLTRAEREMIVVATSGANQCQYCVVAHGAILRLRAKNPLIADQVAINHRKADLEPRQRAMLDFALRVALESHTVEEDSLRALQAYGFTRDDAWDIASIAAFFAMSNRLANAASMRPNDEFYLMGRVPKAK